MRNSYVLQPPTVNAYGRLYGSPKYSTDVMPIFDPKKHTVVNFII